jgi:glycine/D-amino acid oxidase-like deaminating enzyme
VKAIVPIEQACYWLARRPPREAVRLEGAQAADVVIVGAGLTGLWTAIFLKELDPGLAVAVIERGLAAHGASGRNAGIVSETVDHSHGLAIEHFGEAEARRLARLGEANLAELVGFLDHRGIDCDYEPTGRFMVALSDAHLEHARETVATARRLGLNGFRLLDRGRIQGELYSPLYLGAVSVSSGGILDPVKLVEGLRTEAERVGVRVYEQSPVERLESAGAGVRAQSRMGRIDARRADLATSAYTHRLLPGVIRRFIPL